MGVSYPKGVSNPISSKSIIPIGNSDGQIPIGAALYNYNPEDGSNNIVELEVIYFPSKDSRSEIIRVRLDDIPYETSPPSSNINLTSGPDEDKCYTIVMFYSTDSGKEDELVTANSVNCIACNYYTSTTYGLPLYFSMTSELTQGEPECPACDKTVNKVLYRPPGGSDGTLKEYKYKNALSSTSNYKLNHFGWQWNLTLWNYDIQIKVYRRPNELVLTGYMPLYTYRDINIEYGFYYIEINFTTKDGKKIVVFSNISSSLTVTPTYGYYAMDTSTPDIKEDIPGILSVTYTFEQPGVNLDKSCSNDTQSRYKFYTQFRKQYDIPAQKTVSIFKTHPGWEPGDL